jgi:hypothetical protein
LRHAGAATKMINGSAPLTPTVPIPPTDGAVAFHTGFTPGMDAMPSNTAQGLTVANNTLRANGTSSTQDQVFTVHIPVQSTTTLSYDFLPADTAGRNVTVELAFTDGTSASAVLPGSAAVGSWSHVSDGVGARSLGKTISGVVVHTPSGQHDASIDNLQITN